MRFWDIPLIDWWNEQEKNASYFSSQLTKDLVSIIQETDSDDIKNLQKLFQCADQWMILKEYTPTSRYHQVASLRNNIFNYLVNDRNVPAQELYKLNRNTMKITGYFYNHWVEGSEAASWFKSEETLVLNAAFAKHAKNTVSEMNDQDLLNALHLWISKKSETQSKRYGLVLEMAEHLEEVINNCYLNVQPHHQQKDTADIRMAI